METSEKLFDWKHTFSLSSFVRNYINGGMLLMFVALLAMILANSPWANSYFDFWKYEVALKFGDFNLFNHRGHPLTLLAFINDALMAVFFFATGLEIKREALVGELSSVRQALLPIIGACGGMIIPVAIFYLVARDTPASVGIAVPMATDIAFSLGILSLFSKRVPLSLKIFLTTFAVADDIGGILIIAIFYTSELSWFHLLISLFVLAVLCIGNLRGIYNRWFYIFFGIIMWYLFMQGGIHATIAGVIVAFTIPAKPRYNVGKFVSKIKDTIAGISIPKDQSIVLDNDQIDALKHVEAASNRTISPLQSLSDSLSGIVTYFIMPLFAFANAGVAIMSADGSITYGVASTGIILGLVLGKFIGIYSFSALTIKFGFSKMPTGMTYKNLTGVCVLGGVGFTVALFIANLSYGVGTELLDQAKIGVVCGTIISGIIGCIVLRMTLPKKK